MISTAIYTYLQSDANVTAVVDVRVYPLISPQDPTSPYLTFDEASDNRFRTFDGQDQLTEAFVDVDCWASDYDTAKSLQKTAIDSLKSMEGIISSIIIYQTTASAGPDVYEHDVSLYRCNIQLTIDYLEQ